MRLKGRPQPSRDRIHHACGISECSGLSSSDSQALRTRACEQRDNPVVNNGLLFAGHLILRIPPAPSPSQIILFRPNLPASYFHPTRRPPSKLLWSPTQSPHPHPAFRPFFALHLVVPAILSSLQVWMHHRVQIYSHFAITHECFGLRVAGRERRCGIDMSSTGISIEITNNGRYLHAG